MRVLVCGSRTLTDARPIQVLLEGCLHEAWALNERLIVIEGGCPSGADFYAADWADACDLAHVQFRADWDKHGRAAGPIRNQRMLTEGQPDVVWAFVDKPLAESRGTANMVGLARAQGVPTYVVETS